MYEFTDVLPVLCAFAAVGGVVRFIYACGKWIDAEGARAS